MQGEPSLGSIYDKEEIDTVNKVLLESMDPSVGFYAAKEIEEFEEEFKKLTSTRHAISFNGMGSALDLVIKALEIKPGDEIISCSINFPGTHLSVIGNGAKLILCEPDQKTINLDPYDVQKRLASRTKAILVTHMNGLAADIDLLKEIINQSSLFGENKPKIICDAARSIGTTYKGKHLGGEGWATLFSLQSKKLITTLGEGGMVTTDDDNLASTLTKWRSFGKFKTWGSNFKLTKLQAAVGKVQLKKLANLVNLRRELAEARHQAFSKIKGITLQTDTSYSQSSYYLYTMILPENKGGIKRDQLMKVLKEQYGIGSVVGNPPTYRLNELIKTVTAGQQLPLSDNLGERIICVCIHPAISAETNNFVIDSFTKAYETIFA